MLLPPPRSPPNEGRPRRFFRRVCVRVFRPLEPAGKELEPEDVEVHRGADRVCAEAGGDRQAGGEGYPSDVNFGADFPRLEGGVRRIRGRRSAAGGSTRGREREAHPAIYFPSTYLQRRLAGVPAITSTYAILLSRLSRSGGVAPLARGAPVHLPLALARVGRGLRSVAGSKLISACSGKWPVTTGIFSTTAFSFSSEADDG
jgi:hypothetical protein